MEIEDIEAMRRHVGVDDVELRRLIRRLRIGNRVRLTLLAGPAAAAGLTVLVRITGIRGVNFRGKLASPAPSGLQAGARVAFTAAHIHSLPSERLTHARGRS